MLRDGTGRARAVDVSSREDAADVERVLKRFARTLEYTFRVAGRHPSGPSFEDLLEYLADQDRDFTHDSPKLRAFVLRKLVEDFGDARKVPSVASLRVTASAAIAEWVTLRIEMGRDADLRPLSAAYRAFKRRAGLYARVGMATGSLRNAVRDRGRAVIR